MVYDEGFEMRMNGHIFFGFSQFFPVTTATDTQKREPHFSEGVKKAENGSSFYTDCNKTVMGW